MFKKLKDKIAEEVKQSPSKISATVSHLAQAVVSPSSSSVIEPSSTTDTHFSISDDVEDTPRNSPSKWGFTSVDLREAASPQPPGAGIRSRRSSTSSVLSDASSLFPVYESPGNMFHLQSDLESASELDDSFSSHMTSTSKEQLVNVLRKTQQRYNKYKGRYSDLARHYRELERENVKAKAILTESQDKALRRIAELKEQCVLEQRAKAHLEEILRNDLEEKDHLIMTLNTKIEFLKSDDPADASLNGENNGKGDFTQLDATSKLIADLQITKKQEETSNTLVEKLVHAQNNAVVEEVNLSTSSPMESEDLLKEKVRKLELLLAKCKDAIKIHKEKVKEFSSENEYLKSELSNNKESSKEQLKMLTVDLNAARTEMELLKKREEESALSLAETKRSIHSEMEVKEEQIKHLRDSIHGVNEQKQELTEKCNQLQSQVGEMKRLQELGITCDNEKQIQELSRVKQEAVKLLQAETQKNMSELKESMTSKIQELESQIQELVHANKQMQTENSDLTNQENELKLQNATLQDQRKHLEVQITALQFEINEMSSQQKRLLDESNLSKRQNFALQEQAIKIENINRTLRRKSEQYEAKCIEVQRENTEWQNKLDALHLINAGATTKQELQSSEIVKELEAKITELRNENSKCNELNNQLVEDKHQLEANLVKKDSEISLKSQVIAEIQDKQGLLEKIHNELTDRNAQLICEISELEKSKLEQLTKLNCSVDENVQLDRKYKELLDTKTNLDIELLTVSRNLQSAGEMITALNADHENNKKKWALDIKAKECEAEEYKETAHSQTEIISHLQTELNKLNDDIQLKDKSIVQLSDEVQTLHQDISRLNETVTGDISSMQTQLERERMQSIETKNHLQEQLENERNKASGTIKELQTQLEGEKNKTTATISQLQKQVESKKNKASTALSQVQKQLDGEKKKAKATIVQLQEELEGVKNKTGQLEEQLEKEKNTARATIDQLQDQLESENKKATNTISQLQEELEGKNKKTGQLEEQLEREKTSARATIDQLQDQLESEKKKATDTISQLQEEREGENKKTGQLEKQLEREKNSARGTIAQLQEQLKTEKQKASATIGQLQEEVKSEKHKTSQLEEQLESEKNKATGTISQLQEQLGREKNNASEISNRLEGEKKEASAIISQLEEQLENEKHKISQLEEKLENESNKVSGTFRQLQDHFEDEQKKSSATISELQDKLDGEKSTIIELREQLEKERSTASRTIKQLQAQLEELEEKTEDTNSQLMESLKDVNELQLRGQSIESMLHARSEELAKKTGMCVDLQQKLDAVDDLPLKITLLGEQLEQVNTENSVLRQQIKKDTECLTNQCMEIEEINSEKLRLEQSLKDKIDREVDMSGIVEQLRCEKEQLSSQVENGQSVQESFVQYTSDLKELEHKLNESCRIIEMKDTEINDMQEAHRHKIKQLARDFDDKLHDREEEMTKVYDAEKADQEQSEGVMAIQLRNQIKSLKAEVRQLDETIDNLKEQHDNSIKGKEFEVSSLEERMEELRLVHEMQLRESEKIWRQCMDREMEAKELSHKEEVAALSKEWHWERKNISSNESANPEELECTSQVAVAAVESGTGSLELMHRQLMQVTQELKEAKRRHKLESVELRRVMASSNSAEGTTELEYLRNILFEYMMGRETTVLARVIAAVLKFDQEQTNKVIEKEEHKQSLLGQLGIL